MHDCQAEHNPRANERRENYRLTTPLDHKASAASGARRHVARRTNRFVPISASH
jgi:hypothetical protein